jgi:SAM-dependent methyltransferase
LEIGVGRGNLLSSLKTAGYDVVGLDLSPAVCKQVQERYAVTVRCGTVESHANETPAGTYDIILMCHVLEHIDSLRVALSAIRRLLKAKGILYVAVPNVSSWNARLPGWTGYEPYHRHYFRPDTLRHVLESAGFKVKFEKTAEPISGWFNAITRSVLRRLPDLEPSARRNTNHDNRILWFTYNVMRIAAGALISPLRWLQSGLGYGEELIMMAQPVASDNGKNG